MRLRSFVIALLLFAPWGLCFQASAQQVCGRCIRAHMDFLASDALRGRGSGTPDELIAATYIASELEQYGIEPLGDNGTFLQHAAVTNRKGEEVHTWNVVAKIPAREPLRPGTAVLLTAHLDALGVGKAVNGDDIYNGADDDASGSTAVLEFARFLATQPKPRRTIIFAWFGSEELGGLGSQYFRAHPPAPLNDVAAYLEFEMIGRPDPAVFQDTLWLTGWNRTNLGPALALHGAHLVADPHPAEHFFRRSDNYVFAEKGMIAQTVSSYGLHTDYHQPSDDLSHIDFKHMENVIGSLLRPILWLVNSEFVPQWNEGKQPNSSPLRAPSTPR